jgi:hypothetical protein
VTPPTFIPTLGLVVISTGTGCLCQPDVDGEVAWRTGTHDTPLPADLWLACGIEVPTGQELMDPMCNLISDAKMVIHSLAFLQPDHDAERRVDAWVKKNEPPIATRPLEALQADQEPELG